MLSTKLLALQICYPTGATVHRPLSVQLRLPPPSLSSLSSSAQQVTYKYEDRVATCKDEIFPKEEAKTVGSQQAARSPDCAPNFPNQNFGASRTPKIMLHC